MRHRCYFKQNPAYKNYGGRGITICDEWRTNFDAFHDWGIVNGYKKGLSIERIDNDKGYYPENCKWATIKEQANNKRTNHFLTFNNETLTIAQWSEKLNIPYSRIRARVQRKYPIEKILSINKKERR